MGRRTFSRRLADVRAKMVGGGVASSACCFDVCLFYEWGGWWLKFERRVCIAGVAGVTD